MTETLDHQYERRIKEAEIEYGQAVAKLNADFQDKLKPYNQTYEKAVQLATEHKDQMVQLAMNEFDRNTAELRKTLEDGIKAAAHVWGKRVADAEKEWHSGMELVPVEES